MNARKATAQEADAAIYAYFTQFSGWVVCDRFDCTCNGDELYWSEHDSWYLCSDCNGDVSQEEIMNYYNEPYPYFDEDGGE